MTGRLSFLLDQLAVPFVRSVRTSVLLTLALALPLAGCAMQFSSRSLGVPVTMAEPEGQTVPGDTFNVTTKAVHLFWGLAPAKQPNLQQLLAGQLGAGASVHSLVIRTHKSFSDVVFTGITLGLISPTSVSFRGVIAHPSP